MKKHRETSSIRSALFHTPYDIRGRNACGINLVSGG